ncbi:MAG: ABC transporter ATP-binding protein [Planctomycetota bacterium]|nr:ABC transporter ATP-binding protein [Planctomycetota bacterium]
MKAQPQNDLKTDLAIESHLEPVIRLERLTKCFKANVALDHVSLEVPPGVVFALLGENGAGKTTAIRIMLGLLDADDGRANVLGLDSRNHGLEIRRRIGYVPEQPTLYDWMTVAEIGWFTAGFYGNGFLMRYQQLTTRFELPDRRKLKALSKGMRAKVVLSLALANDPELLILDEPTSGLDALVRRQFLESMVDRAATGKSVFLSSHQINEVERVADIVGIIRDGHLIAVERLERMKNEIREVTITLVDGAGSLPDLPGQTIMAERRGRQWQVLLRDAVESDLSALSGNSSVQNVEFRVPTLEEIFVAYMKGDRGESLDTGDAQ